MKRTILLFLPFLSCFLAIGQAAAELPTAKPAEVGLSEQALAQVDAKMEELVKEADRLVQEEIEERRKTEEQEEE